MHPALIGLVIEWWLFLDAANEGALEPATVVEQQARIARVLHTLSRADRLEFAEKVRMVRDDPRGNEPRRMALDALISAAESA